MYALGPTGRCRAARGGADEDCRVGRGRPGLRAGFRAVGGGTHRGREEGETAVGGAAPGAGAAGSECETGDEFCDVFQRRALAVPFPVEPMTEEVAADSVVDPGGKHAILEGMAQGVHRVARGLEQAVGAEKLVHDRAEGGAVPVVGEAIGVLLDSFQRDTGQRDNAARVVRLELPPLGLDGNMRHVAIEPDRVRRQRRALGRSVAGVDHSHDQGAGLAVQPVERVGREQPRPDPLLAERRARQLLAFLEGQLAQRQRQAEPLHRVHGLQHIAQMDEVLVGRVGGDLARLDPVEPVLAEVQHVVASNIGDFLVAHDRDEVLHRLLARRFPAAQLILALTKGLLFGKRPIKLQRLGDRDPGFGDSSEKGCGFQRIGLVRGCRDRLDALDDIPDRQLCHSPRIQIAKASRPRQCGRTFSTPQDTEIASFILALKPANSHALSVGPVGISTGLTTYLVSQEPAAAEVDVSNGVLFDHVLVSLWQE